MSVTGSIRALAEQLVARRGQPSDRETRMRREEDSLSRFLQQNPNIDIRKAASLFPAARPAFVEILSDQQKEQRRRQKLTEQAGQAGAPDNLNRQQVLGTLRRAEDVTGGPGLPGSQRTQDFESVAAAALAQRSEARSEALRPEDRSRFLSNAATLISVDEARFPQVQQIARQTLGPDSDLGLALIATNAAAQRIERQLANRPGPPTSEERREKREIAAFRRDGASEIMARLAIDGRAYKDPLTGVWARGSPTGQRANAASLRGALFETATMMEKVAEEFARQGGANAFTGTLEDFSARAGFAQDPLFAAYQVLEKQAQSILQKARSGAVLNEQEIRQLEASFPQVAQIQLRDGKLDAAARTRFKSLNFVLGREHISQFDRGDRARAKRALDGVRRETRRSGLSEILDSVSLGKVEDDRILQGLEAP